MKGYVVYACTDENGNIGFGNIVWNFVHNKPSSYELDSCKGQVRSWNGYKSVVILNVIPLIDDINEV